MVAYIIRDIDKELWKRVKAKAATEDISIKDLMLGWLRLYLEQDIDAVVPAPPAPKLRKKR